MPISISNLTINPPLVKKGNVRCKVSFDAVMTTTGGNPVTLNLFIHPQAQVFLVDAAGNELKRLTFSQNMDGSLKNYALDVMLRVKEKPKTPTRVDVRLEGEDAIGFRSSKSSFIVQS